MTSQAKQSPNLPLLNVLFWSVVGGLVFCLAMTIYTAVQKHAHDRVVESAAKTMPLPADAPAQAHPAIPAN